MTISTWDRVLDRADLKYHDKVVAVGGAARPLGFGALARLGWTGRVTFCDTSRELLDECRRAAAGDSRCSVVHGSLAALAGIAPRSVDVIVAGTVPDGPDRTAAFAGFTRVLRPGGRLSFSGAVDNLDRDDLVARASAAGFENVTLEYHGSTPVAYLRASLPGQMVSLAMSLPRLTDVTFGVGWDVRSTTGASIDLDGSALLCGADGRVRTDHDFVFFNNLRSQDGSVEHQGDTMTGFDGGDDEQVTMNLVVVPADVQKIVLAVSLYDAQTRFGQVTNGVARVVSSASDIGELVRLDLTFAFPDETAVVVGELYRDTTEWKYRPVGRGYPSLRDIAIAHGVNV